MPRTSLTLAQMRERYVTCARPMPASVEAALRDDPRPGAQSVLAAVQKRRFDNRAEGQRLRTMLRFETEFWTQGLRLIAGVDEAGMSPLAGPVAAGAVIFAPNTRIPGVDDCKRLDPRERERLAPLIRAQAVAWSVAFVEPDEIDTLNIYWAGVAAMKRAVAGLGVVPEHVLLDGRRIKDFPHPHRAIIKGDQKSLSIAAASILAKTERDERMRKLDAVHPGYGFAIHKGYPVKAHFEALARLGPCAIHRRSFAPVRQAGGLPIEGEVTASQTAARSP